VTPLNFVCKCRTPLPARKRPAVFREIRIEQIFGRACTCDLFFAHCRNADESRVFVTRRCLLFSFARAARSAACARFRSRESARSKRFTKAKFFCGEPPEMVLRPASRGAKRTNRRPAIRFGSARGSHSCSRTTPARGDFRRRARPSRRIFSHARTPKAVALRYRDASSAAR
jgi:hypothetical protein